MTQRLLHPQGDEWEGGSFAAPHASESLNFPGECDSWNSDVASGCSPDLSHPHDPVATSSELSHLMQQAEELLQQRPGFVSVQPTLEVAYGRFALKLSVSDGNSAYVVKSIGEFAHRVASGVRFAYGKKLSFAHDLAAFDAPSQELLRWLLATLGEGVSLEEPLPWEEPEEDRFVDVGVGGWNSGGYGSLSSRGVKGRPGTKAPGSAGSPKRALELTPDQLVAFLETQVGRWIDIDCDDYSRPRRGSVEVRRGVPDDLGLVEVREAEGGFRLFCPWEVSGVVSSAGCALLVDDGFYVTGPQFAPVARLLHAIEAAGGELAVSHDDAPLFGATLLPPLERQVKLKAPPALLRYRPEPLQLQFSFDVVDNAIQVDAQALYGTRAIPLAISPESLPAAMEEAPDGQPIVVGIADAPLEIRDRSFYRNRAGEARALQLLLAYFPPTGVLPLASDNAAAALLLTGLAQFRAMGEVFTTPAFNRLIRPRPPRLQLGLSLAGDLIALDVSSEDMELPELLALLDSYRRRRTFHRLSDGSFVSLANFEDRGFARLVEDMGLSLEDVKAGRVDLPTYQAFYLENELQGVYRDQGFLEFVGRFRAPAPESLEPVPACLRGVLRPYQEEGFRWLQALWAMGFGGILADEMGLGKTLQVIALLLAVYGEGDHAPGSLLSATPDVSAEPAPNNPDVADPSSGATPASIAGPPPATASAAVAGSSSGATPANIEGSSLRRAEILSLPRQPEVASGQAPTLIVCPASLVYNWTAEFAKFAPQLKVAAVAGTPAQRRAARNDAGAQVLVTSYDSLRVDAKDWEALPLTAAVLDEAHYIKNHATKTTRAVKRLQAKRRLALTGTPVENRPAELWSIFDFLMPGFLGTAMHFRERFEAPVIGGDEEALRRLSCLVGPFVLRRLKRDVLQELPPKLETVLEVQLEGEQRKLYFAAEQSLRERLNLQKNTAKARRYGHSVKGIDGGEFKTVEVLAELTRLRQIALDPALVFENYRGTGAKRGAILERIQAAMEAGEKTLVFSQFTSFLQLVAEDLRQRGVAYHAITGATPKRQRAQLVEAFNRDDVPVFLVSLRAGGVGLNLTGATQVIHADPWWNSSAQNQASDRAHRIGQQRVVAVCNVVAAGTIEARMLRLQQIKAQLADSLIGASAGDSLSSLTPELLSELLSD